MSTSSLDKRPVKQFRGEIDDITFSDKDAHHVCHSHCDALVIKAMIANNNIHWLLVDNGSSVDILYYQAFERVTFNLHPIRSTDSQGILSSPRGDPASNDLGKVP